LTVPAQADRSAAAGAFSLAIDAMGGDHAPESILDGLELAAERHPQARFLLVGDEARIGGALALRPRAAKACSIRHAPETISGDMKPTAALRIRGSSMRVAIDAVASREAAGVVSAGNTGALMALAKIVVKTLPEIDRPALAAIGPSARGDVVMLDLGANVVCDARNLVEFAVMGDAFARAVLGLTNPTLGLLNVGSEELRATSGCGWLPKRCATAISARISAASSRGTTSRRARSTSSSPTASPAMSR
jgi:glycerol-3-phosphate acyltransferase PlsX